MKEHKKAKWKNPRMVIYGIITMVIVSIIGLFLGQIATASVIITDIEFLGVATLPTGYTFQNTEIGGLSGITYDVDHDLYYVVSDNRGQKGPPRFYNFKIDLSKGKLDQSKVLPVGVTTLLDENNRKFALGGIDPEGIAVTKKSTVFISSEGDVSQSINPFIREFSLASGNAINSLPIPEKFLPDGKNQRGVHNSLTFESLTITPNNQMLFTATENALVQDGEAAKPKFGTLCRILQYNLTYNQPQKEFLYPMEPVTPLFNFMDRFYSGLSDLVALDNRGNFLSLERSFTGVGFAVSLFEVSLNNADDIQNIPSLKAIDIGKIKPVEKKLLLDLQTLPLPLDNIEGLTIGPKLSDGNISLILVGDNNFNRLQSTQILALKLKRESPLKRLLHQLGLTW
ncbi:MULTISPECIES: esterase-like activity of phytase family protein [Cylindrospermopsis]|uniref:Esterase-like activity of phytase family protein n=1 Tax=Cylindrospermopsis curvispora GIHE-G1 TaxID=2666332 RepID=A0A7H0F0U3_9CYAN|nr:MULTISPECIES: esterase-like activity of phytase family protein [Cylindrospermopsis]KRH97593.1 hypothetical protein ASL19_00955 [Cylindrospermopsis sp. CR12]QNP29659.1 esterase-like activity of phytase family protein [Cylindrospermopsis curvispora GIHE-G1]